MEDLPTPFELASLTYAVRAWTQYDHFEDAMDEALRVYELARAKLDVASGKVRVEGPLDSFFKHTQEQPRMEFEPDSTDDEVRRFLNDPGMGAAPRGNLKKGKTVRSKLHGFFLDRAVLRGETKEKAEGDFLSFLGDERINAKGKPVYAVPFVQLEYFKRWHHEVTKLQALLRGNPNTPPLEIRVRLAMAAMSFKDKDQLRSIYEADLDHLELSKKIISEIQSLKVEKQRKGHKKRSEKQEKKRRSTA